MCYNKKIKNDAYKRNLPHRIIAQTEILNANPNGNSQTEIYSRKFPKEINLKKILNGNPYGNQPNGNLPTGILNANPNRNPTENS